MAEESYYSIRNLLHNRSNEEFLNYFKGKKTFQGDNSLPYQVRVYNPYGFTYGFGVCFCASLSEAMKAIKANHSIADVISLHSSEGELKFEVETIPKVTLKVK
jgi:hypothetical protein